MLLYLVVYGLRKHFILFLNWINLFSLFKKIFVGMSSCPYYYLLNHAGGSGRQFFVVSADLKTEANTSD